MLLTAASNILPPSPPPGFKDPRADSLCFQAMQVFASLEIECPPLRTACIAFTDLGCEDHLPKVVEAAQAGKVRPGVFSRMGPHTIATFFAMGFQLHGPAFAYLGSDLSGAFDLARTLIETRFVDVVCLIHTHYKRCSIYVFSL